MSYNIRTTLDVQGNLNISPNASINGSGNLNIASNANISGSLSVTGSINGNLNGTATSASYVLNAISSSFASTASFAPNYLLTSNTRSFATTGSNIFIGNQTITGSILLTASNATYALDITGIGRMSSLTIGNGTLMGLYPVSDGFNFANNGSQLRLQGNLLSTAGYGVNIINSNGNKTWTTGNGGDLQVWGNYTPTSGNGTHNGIIITNTISQSGAANGITRGLYINPTLTSAVDYRAIESTSGSIIFNHGSNVLFYASSSGNVAIGTTSSLGRLQVRGDGTNATIRGEDSTGVVKFSVASSTGTPELLLHSNGGFNLNSKFQSLSQNAIDITNQGLTLSNINNTNQGVIGISGYTFAPAAGSGSFRPINLAYTINASGPQVGSVTGILVNATETSLSGSTHNLIDLQISGSSRFKVNNTSTIITGSLLITGSSITIGSTTISSTTTSTFVGGVGSDIYTTYGSQNKPITLRFKTGTTPSTLTQGVVIENALSSYIVTNQVGSFGMLDLTAVAYQPTAGGADFYGINLSNTINSQGSGSIKAIYYNPTITRITGSHRFIESTAGDVLIQSGSYPLLFVTGSGRVGIGTATPAGKLDVRGNATVAQSAVLTAGDLVVDTDNKTVYIGRQSNTSGDNTNFIFRDRIGGIKSYWENASSGCISFGNFGTNYGVSIANATLATSATSSARLVVDSGISTFPAAVFQTGNVGIGTVTPNATLDVSGSINISGSGTQIPFRIASGSASLLVVSSSGNVGIGTATPAYDLDILTPSGDTNYLRVAGNGVSNTNGNITLGNVTGTAGVFAPLLSSKSSNLSYPGMYFIGDGASGTDSGTQPMIRFDGRINNGTVATRPLIGFANAGTDLVTILANGNSGFGTNAPSTKLHAKGTTSGSGVTAFRVENLNSSASMTINDLGTTTLGGSLVLGGVNSVTSWGVNGSATIMSANGNHSGQIELRPNNLTNSFIYFSNVGSGGGLYLGTSKYFSNPYSVFASGSVIVGDYGFANNTAAPARFAVSGSGAQTLVNVESPGSSSIFNISGNGRVGIGTSTPGARLDVFGTGQIINMGNGTSTDAYIDFAGNRGKFGFESATGIRFQGTNTRPIVFALGVWGTGEIARFSTQGFFGLNTNNPSAWLHISGTVASGSLLRIDAPGSSSIFEVSGSGVVTINGSIPVTRNATGYNVGRFTNSASFDNILVAISSSGNPVASSVSGSVNVFYNTISSVVGSAISSSINTGAIFTTGSWSVLTSATLGSGGDTITSHIQDQDRGRLYRATFIQTAGPTSGSVVIERLI